MAALEFARFRRLRNNPIIRDMLRDVHLGIDDFVYPLFAAPGEKFKKPVSSMPGVFQLSVDNIIEECKALVDMGIRAVILFGIPENKDPEGSGAYSEDGIIQRTIRAIKKEVSDLLVISDVCFCEYTSHGHCGILHDEEIVNDETIFLLAKTALSHVQAGANMVAPSDMMDGRVAAIRKMLDEHKYKNIPIMSYSAKYASAYYGPFREAAEGAPKFGDRKSHQMDYRQRDEALREVEADIEEGADIVMVKPAGPYLDIITRVKETFAMPVAAYQVSGEYSMIKAGAQLGWVNEDNVMLESLYSIKRAGADLIISYFAKDFAQKYA